MICGEYLEKNMKKSNKYENIHENIQKYRKNDLFYDLFDVFLTSNIFDPLKR